MVRNEPVPTKVSGNYERGAGYELPPGLRNCIWHKVPTHYRAKTHGYHEKSEREKPTEIVFVHSISTYNSYIYGIGLYNTDSLYVILS
jgi:hypothetical protein